MWQKSECSDVSRNQWFGEILWENHSTWHCIIERIFWELTDNVPTVNRASRGYMVHIWWELINVPINLNNLAQNSRRSWQLDEEIRNSWHHSGENNVIEWKHRLTMPESWWLYGDVTTGWVILYAVKDENWLSDSKWLQWEKRADDIVFKYEGLIEWYYRY